MLNSIYILWVLLKPHVAQQRKLLFLALFFTASATACSLVATWQLKLLIDLPKVGGSVNTFIIGIAVVAAIYVLAFVFWAGQHTLGVMATERIFIDVKARLLTQLLDQPRSFFDGLRDADICSRLQGDLRLATITFRDDVMAGSFEIFFIFLIVAAVIAVNWHIGLAIALGLLFYALVLTWVERAWSEVVRTAHESSDKQKAIFLDILAAARDIRVFNLRDNIERQFGEVTQHYANTQIRLNQFNTGVQGFFRLAGVLTMVILVASYGILIIRQDSPSDGVLSAGELVLLFAILTVLLNTLNQVLMRVGRLISAEPSLAGVNRLMVAPVVSGLAHRQPFSQEANIPDEPSVEFSHISYSRMAGTPLLSDLTLRIEAGEKVALMGASGTGKSILLDLMMRLREPAEGKIFYSGIDICQIAPALYYSAFGFVGQHSHIMQLSLRAFLQQGWPGQSDDDLWRILQVVKLTGVVRSLPQQLNTQIGLRGWEFSNAQRQRLAVARALLRDPQVLVLDDFTAALDAAEELELVRDVLAASKHRTVICTTYSTAVSSLFDRVVAL